MKRHFTINKDDPFVKVFVGEDIQIFNKKKIKEQN